VGAGQQPQPWPACPRLAGAAFAKVGMHGLGRQAHEHGNVASLGRRQLAWLSWLLTGCHAAHVDVRCGFYVMELERKSNRKKKNGTIFLCNEC